jgi:hypothetical protein
MTEDRDPYLEFYCKPGSPCIHAGTDGIPLPETDKDGNDCSPPPQSGYLSGKAHPVTILESSAQKRGEVSRSHNTILIHSTLSLKCDRMRDKSSYQGIHQPLGSSKHRMKKGLGGLRRVVGPTGILFRKPQEIFAETCNLSVCYAF